MEKLNIDNTRMLNKIEEDKLKKDISKTEFFESPKPIGGIIVNDGIFHSLGVTIDNKTTSMWWPTWGEISIPEPVRKKLELISIAANK